MRTIIINGYTALELALEDATFVFTLGDKGFNFNRAFESLKDNLSILKKHYNLNDIGYIKQYHSNLVFNYTGEVLEGDGLYTKDKNVAVGVFAADCVPVLLYDKKEKTVAAIHSGWKGTYDTIVSEAILKMHRHCGAEGENIVAVIGPHIKSCCYEVGENVVDKFTNSPYYKEQQFIKENKLSMEDCIKYQLKKNNVLDENIILTNICTYCSKTPTFSYRRGEVDKRMFAMVFTK